MKLARAVFIFFIVMLVQVSFVRLLDFYSLAPNFPLITIFIASYFLSFENLLVLSVIAGIMMDLTSAASFGASSLSMLGAFSLGYCLKENIFKEKKAIEPVLNGLVIFLIYYFLLNIVDGFLKSSLSFAVILGWVSAETAREILFNLTIGILLLFLIKRNKKSKLC